MASLTLHRVNSSFPVLLARYMHGEITDNMWTRVMRLLDADGVTAPERMAFARFVSDLVAEGGEKSLLVPKEEEVNDLLVETRH